MNTIDLIRVKSKITLHGLVYLGVLVSLFQTSVKWIRQKLFYVRREIIHKLAGHSEDQEIKKPKVSVAIVHITSTEEATDPEQGKIKIERLHQTIDGLLGSFAHCQLRITIITMANRNIVTFLPQYQQRFIEIREITDGDPMLIGFPAQEELFSQIDDFDWFLFIEDDIVLRDSFLLEKLEQFNQNCGCNNAILLPNRYELYEGVKNYIDFTIDETLAWNKVSVLNIHGVKFAEWTNPHSGLYCLSQAQMQLWQQSGRQWGNRDLGFGGPRESAATFCLLECFSVYKPHFSNLNFLEVEHYDSKYSMLYSNSSLYRLVPKKI